MKLRRYSLGGFKESKNSRLESTLRNSLRGVFLIGWNLFPDWDRWVDAAHAPYSGVVTFTAWAIAPSLEITQIGKVYNYQI